MLSCSISFFTNSLAKLCEDEGNFAERHFNYLFSRMFFYIHSVSCATTIESLIISYFKLFYRHVRFSFFLEHNFFPKKDKMA